MITSPSRSEETPLVETASSNSYKLSMQKLGRNSEMCHPRCVYKLIGGGVKSITQQVYMMMFIREDDITTCFGLFRPS